MFIPLCFSSMDVSSERIKQASSIFSEEFSDWEKVDDDVKYMLKYVSDKFDSKGQNEMGTLSPGSVMLQFALENSSGGDKSKCLCYHFKFKDDAREKYGIYAAQDWYHLVDQHVFQGQETDFRFQITDIEMFCFSTCISIMTFRIVMERSEPFWISSAQYYLKKVSQEEISTGKNRTNFLQMTESLCKGLGLSDLLDWECFYYANKGRERANFLTYVELAGNKNAKECFRELYYLRHCYGDGYIYFEDPESERREIFQSTGEVVWGVSSEAAVCLAFPDKGYREFIQKELYPNFVTQYLFMYVMLLHQKYFLYLLLNNVATYNDIRQLEKYENQLYEFKADFVYTFVTEVPQYQILYERMSKAFAITEMYEDVEEPLISLGRKRKENEENKEKARDNALNTSLGLIAFLAVFSALVDSFDFFGSFLSQFGREKIIPVVQNLCVLAIVVIAVCVVARLIKNIHQRNKRD